jgi:hypothetical protein
VVALMGVLSFGCLVVFGAKWLKGDKAQQAEVELLDDAASGRPAAPAPKRAGPVRTTHSLRPADLAISRKPTKPASPKQAAQNDDAPSDAVAAAPRKDAASAKPPPILRPPARQAPAAASRAAAPARPAPRRAVASTSAARSRTAPRRPVPRITITRGAQAAALRRHAGVSAVASSPKSPAQKPNYRPPTARFED